MGIYQDLVDGHGFTGGYQSVQRFVRKLRGAVSPEARVIIETRPGEESQVDYGTGPMVRDPDPGLEGLGHGRPQRPARGAISRVPWYWQHPLCLHFPS